MILQIINLICNIFFKWCSNVALHLLHVPRNCQQGPWVVPGWAKGPPLRQPKMSRTVPCMGWSFQGTIPPIISDISKYKWLVTGVNPLIHRIIYENGEWLSRVIDHLQAVGWPSKYLGWIWGSGFRRIHCTKIKYAQKPGRYNPSLSW